MKPLHIGIDLGSMGLRVAYATDGSEAVSFEHGPVEEAGWLFCERSPASRSGVSFPSLKSRLGASAQLSYDDGSPAPSQTLTKALSQAKRSVEEQTGRPVAQAVICVPALYPTSQREALHDAALAARFTAAHLINDSVGAVTAHTTGRPSPATVLVFGAGYHGFELGLTRVVKGHVRVLAYEGGGMAGADLDQLVLESLLHTIRASGWVLSEGQWEEARWMSVRAAAQTVKERLGATELAEFPLGIVRRSGGVLQVNFRRQDFEEVVRDAFLPAIRLIEDLLQKAGMSRTELDAVVLTGGTTRIPALRSLLAEAVGNAPVVAPPPTSLAVGAALHAAGLGSEPGPVRFEAERVVDTREAKLPAADGVALRATVSLTEGAPASAAFPAPATLTVDQVTNTPGLLAPGSLQRRISQLVKDGEAERARDELNELIREAQAVLDDLPDSHRQATLGPTSPAYRSQLALTKARACLERRQFALAVSESHYAWKLGPDDPDVLDKMIDIHCAAATANSEPEQYEDAIRWLRCALGHDESNARTRSLLAERHYLQAQELHLRGQTKRALQVIDECLRWSPDHPEAVELQQSLVSG
ncbi:MAG: Hsp70 family protein [Pseudonocardiaceae bacterium]